MISYSTGASGTGEDVDKVRQATALVKARRPDLVIDGPIQYDAATVESVGRQKAPGSPVAEKLQSLNDFVSVIIIVFTAFVAVLLAWVVVELRIEHPRLARGESSSRYRPHCRDYPAGFIERCVETRGVERGVPEGRHHRGRPRSVWSHRCDRVASRPWSRATRAAMTTHRCRESRSTRRPPSRTGPPGDRTPVRGRQSGRRSSLERVRARALTRAVPRRA